MPGPNPKEVTKFQQDIKKRKEQIEKTAQLTKKWGKLTGPMTPVDEKTLASGAHGVHGKVHYEKAGPTVEGAKTSPPMVVEKVEVMEIFRFDGQKWKY